VMTERLQRFFTASDGAVRRANQRNTSFVVIFSIKMFFVGLRGTV
jgi:hypothetical protein